jgi:hypothetical protein
MNASQLNTVPDAELNVECVADISTDADTDLNVEFSPVTKRSVRAYRNKLSFLTQVHDEIRSKVNAMREARQQIFFCDTDRYFPDEHFDLADTYCNPKRPADSMPILP